jgi:hypothetical protein
MRTKQKKLKLVTYIVYIALGVDQSAWRGTRKLGSLLGAEEDVARRIQLANVSFGKVIIRGFEERWNHRSCGSSHSDAAIPSNC